MSMMLDIWHGDSSNNRVRLRPRLKFQRFDRHGRYHVVASAVPRGDRIGAGSYGSVLTATDTYIGHIVAIKRQRAGTAAAGAELAFLRRLRSQQHPWSNCVLQLLEDFSTSDDGVFSPTSGKVAVPPGMSSTGVTPKGAGPFTRYIHFVFDPASVFQGCC